MFRSAIGFPALLACALLGGGCAGATARIPGTVPTGPARAAPPELPPAPPAVAVPSPRAAADPEPSPEPAATAAAPPAAPEEEAPAASAWSPAEPESPLPAEPELPAREAGGEPEVPDWVEPEAGYGGLDPGEGSGAPAGEEPETPLGFEIPDRPEVAGVLAEWGGSRRRTLDSALRRGERYLPMIRQVFREEGIPEDLAYLALVESHFHLDARSPSAAVGLWQFIETTGRACGLRIDWWVDERLDPEASTRAAARHLRELYERFEDWELALAAYNAGAYRLEKAIRRGDGGDFWELAEGDALRAETRRYVPKFYAALHLARSSEAPGGGAEPLRFDVVRVSSPVDLGTVARAAEVPAARLRELNPALRRGCTPPSEEPFELRVPAGTGEAVEQALEELPASRRLGFARYRLKPGDTLWELSRRFGAPTAAIMELNGLRDAGRLRPGQELVLPIPAERRSGVAADAAAPGSPEPGVHVVASGETVWSIARRHGLAVADVQRWNRLGEASVLRPGDRLRVRAPDAARDRPPDSSPRVHVVRRGENLWGIARRYGLPLGELLERNGLNRTAVVRPGDRLAVGTDPPPPAAGRLN